jgi:hypothetical protein
MNRIARDSHQLQSRFAPSLFGDKRYRLMARTATTQSLSSCLSSDHCIDAVRQSLIFHTDISPYPFRPDSEPTDLIFPYIWATHTCCDFRVAKEWAPKRRIPLWKLGSERSELKQWCMQAYQGRIIKIMWRFLETRDWKGRTQTKKVVFHLERNLIIGECLSRENHEEKAFVSKSPVFHSQSKLYAI